MREVLIATSNQGKLRDFAAAAVPSGVVVLPVPGFNALPPAREDAPTFEANACKKAEHYSRGIPRRYVLADDSGLEVDALDGAPGVRSARYAADTPPGLRRYLGESLPAAPQLSAVDAANNRRLLAELQDVADDRRGARFVCIIAVACEGHLLACFRGEVSGRILREPRGIGGFGYDPLFYLPSAGHTFAELSPEKKADFSHRGLAFRKFLRWYGTLDTSGDPASRDRVIG